MDLPYDATAKKRVALLGATRAGAMLVFARAATIPMNIAVSDKFSNLTCTATGDPPGPPTDQAVEQSVAGCSTESAVTACYFRAGGDGVLLPRPGTEGARSGCPLKLTNERRGSRTVRPPRSGWRSGNLVQCLSPIR